MKENFENLSPSEIEEIDKGRLSLEEAQYMANMIITKFEDYDLSKLGPEDYEQAMKEIEDIRKWAFGAETTVDKLVEVLKHTTIFGTLNTMLYLGLAEVIARHHGDELNAATYAGLSSLGLFMAAINTKLRQKETNAFDELLELQNKDERRRYPVPNQTPQKTKPDATVEGQ